MCIVNKYNNKYHRTIKMKPVDIKSSMHFDFNKENNKEGPKFKADDHVRISKYKGIFAKGYVPDWSEEAFVIKKVSDLNKQKPLEHFTKRIAKNK